MTDKNIPAFPDFLKDGMTLRDYFASKAMEGLLAGLVANGMDLTWGQVAVDAYRQADAMLKARNN
jgi:hypothetical protein